MPTYHLTPVQRSDDIRTLAMLRYSHSELIHDHYPTPAAILLKWQLLEVVSLSRVFSLPERKALILLQSSPSSPTTLEVHMFYLAQPKEALVVGRFIIEELLKRNPATTQLTTKLSDRLPAKYAAYVRKLGFRKIFTQENQEYRQGIPGSVTTYSYLPLLRRK